MRERARMMYEFCAAHGVRAGGAAADRRARRGEVHGLDSCGPRGTANVVEGLEIVDAAFVRKRERTSTPWPRCSRPTRGILEAEALVRRSPVIARRAATSSPHRVHRGEPKRDVHRASSRTSERITRGGRQTRQAVRGRGLRRAWRLGVPHLPCRRVPELVPPGRRLANALVNPCATRTASARILSKTIHGNRHARPDGRFQDRKDDYESDRLPIESFLGARSRLLPELQLSDLRLAHRIGRSCTGRIPRTPIS